MPDRPSEPDAELDPFGVTSFGIDRLPGAVKLRPGEYDSPPLRGARLEPLRFDGELRPPRDGPEFRPELERGWKSGWPLNCFEEFGEDC